MSGGGDTPSLKHFVFVQRVVGEVPAEQNTVCLCKDRDTLVHGEYYSTDYVFGKALGSSEQFNVNTANLMNYSAAIGAAWPSVDSVSIESVEGEGYPMKISADGFEDLIVHREDEHWVYDTYTPEVIVI